MTNYIYFLSGVFILIAFLLLFYNWKYNKKTLFMALFLILTVLEFLIADVLYFGNKQSLSNLPILIIPFLLIKAPMLYFYIRGVVYDNCKLEKKDILHFIPFALYFLFNIVFLNSFFNKDNTTNTLSILQIRIYQQVNMIFRPIVWNNIVIAIQLFIYAIWSFILLNKNQKISKNMYAQYKYQYRYIVQKLYFIIFILLIISGLDLINDLMYLFKEDSLQLMYIILFAYSLIPFYFFITPKLLYGLPHVETTHISATNLDKLKEGADGT